MFLLQMPQLAFLPAVPRAKGSGKGSYVKSACDVNRVTPGPAGGKGNLVIRESVRGS